MRWMPLPSRAVLMSRASHLHASKFWIVARGSGVMTSAGLGAIKCAYTTPNTALALISAFFFPTGSTPRIQCAATC